MSISAAVFRQWSLISITGRQATRIISPGLYSLVRRWNDRHECYWLVLADEQDWGMSEGSWKDWAEQSFDEYRIIISEVTPEQVRRTVIAHMAEHGEFLKQHCTPEHPYVVMYSDGETHERLFELVQTWDAATKYMYNLTHYSDRDDTDIPLARHVVVLNLKEYLEIGDKVFSEIAQVQEVPATPKWGWSAMSFR